MIKQLASKMAEGIVAVVPEFADRTARIRHTLSFLLNVVPIIAFTTLIGLITGRLPEALLALLAFGALRQLSGGIHLGSSEVCILVTTIGATLLSFSAFGSESIAIMSALSVLLLLVFGPSRIEGKTRIPKRYYPLLKIAAALLAASNLLIGSSVVAAAFLTQSLTVIRFMKGGEKRA